VGGKEALVTGLVAALLVAAPSAHASACNEPAYTARAVAHSHGSGAARHKLPPIAIGDSTMVFAVPYLSKLGFDANARACRSWKEGLGLIRNLKHRHRLPDVVVMALGANSWVRPIDVQEALALVGPKRKLVLMTHRTWFGKPGPDTGVIRRMAHRYRKRTMLLDWVRYAAPHPEWFDAAGYDDGLHTNKLGARKFAQFIARADLAI
jgi:hypothetical protein